jgi:hypothetical protein
MKRRLWVNGIVSFGFLIGLGGPFTLPISTASAQTTAAAPVVVTAAEHAVSSPLSSLPIANSVAPAAAREIPEFALPHAIPSTIQGQSSGDAALQTSTALAPMPTPLENFDGLGNTSLVLPPDPNGSIGYDPATGKKYYVQWINLVYGVWDVTGTPTRRLGPVSGQQIFASLGSGSLCATDGMGDPSVLYDNLSHRWLLTEFAFKFDSFGNPLAPFYQCIAISKTGDPTGAYYLYSFLWGNLLNDYAKLGVWSDGYYMTANQFNGNAFEGVGVAAFERSKMLVGDPTARMIYFDIGASNSTYSGMLPADFEGLNAPPTGAPETFAEVDPDLFMRTWLFRANWTTPSASTFGQSLAPSQQLAVASYQQLPCVTAVSARNCIPQPGGAPLLDGVADRLMTRLVYRNYGDHQALAVNHTVWADGADRAGIRWYELHSSSAAAPSWSIFQQGTYAPSDGSYRWMGSAAMDRNGDLAIGYSVAGPSLNPTIRYAGRLSSDPLGTLGQAESSIIEGGGTQGSTTGRWGDYSMLTVDPVDDCTFWYTQEYYPISSTSGWQTRIASFRFPTCGATAGISGTVNDGTSGGHTWPLYARIDFAGPGGTTTVFSDPVTGAFQATLAAGTYTATVTAVAAGYQVGTFGFSSFPGAGPLSFPLLVDPTTCQAAGYAAGSGKTCAAQTGGLLVGNLLDANTNLPLEGGKISLGSTSANTLTIPNDPAQPGGFYILFGASGAQSVTASMTGGYQSKTLQAAFTANGVTRQDFSLAAGKLTSQLLVSTEVAVGGSGAGLLSLTNTGGAPAHYTLAVNPAGTAWLSVASPSGTIAAGATQTVQFQVQAKGMARGHYQAALTVNTDTPYPALEVPVALSVGATVYLPIAEN